MTRLRLTSFAFCLCLALLGATQLPLSRRVAAYGNQPAQNPQELITASPPLAVPLSAEQSAQREIIAQSPIRFEANRGQTDQAVKFIARGNDYTLFLTGDEMVMALRKRSDESDGRSFRGGLNRSGKKALAPTITRDVVRMRLVKANAVATVEGLAELPTKSNYFIGDDPQDWQTDVPNYGRVRYHAVYPGVDLIYHGDQRQLEYDFVVAPEADPQQIRLAFDGGQTAHVDEQGDLIIETAAGALRQPKPVIYQELNGVRQPVEGSYQLSGAREVGFAVAAYDHSRPLVIDPVLAFSTYFGGSDYDQANAIKADASGIYVCGETLSTDFPTKNPLQANSGGGTDFFVVKINHEKQVLFTTYLGGSGEDFYNYGLAVNGTGIFMTGTTNSPNYPTLNAFQSTFGGGDCDGSPCFDAVVTKLNPTGNALVYSTYLGGSGEEYNENMTLLGNDVYVVGTTSSTNLPTRNPLQAALGGDYDGYVARLNATGSALVFSTYLGGSGDDAITSAGFDGLGNLGAAGNLYLAGLTDSANFPTRNPLQSTKRGGYDAVVVKLNLEGSQMFYSTYLGGGSFDLAYGIEVDNIGTAYVMGSTRSNNFPLQNALQTTYGGGTCTQGGESYPCSDVFMTKLNPAGSALLFSTYLGGSGDDESFKFGLGSNGDVIVAGRTDSSNFPVLRPLPGGEALHAGTCGTAPDTFRCRDGFVTRLTTATNPALIYSTYFGGSGDDSINGFAAYTAGMFLAGHTNSADFPTRNPIQASLSSSGEYDAFITKLHHDFTVGSVASTNAASYVLTVAPESIAAAFFPPNPIISVVVAQTIPLPTQLAGVSVKVKDSQGTERVAPLVFISNSQINYVIPAGAAPGAATVSVTIDEIVYATGNLNVATVAPGLFAANANGTGVPAGVALRVKADGTLSYESILRFNGSSFVPTPIDLGPASDQVFLVLYGTGLRGRSGLSGVTARIGNTDAEVLYAGESPGFVGLDQINLRIPRSLIGRGAVQVALTVDGQPANTVEVNIK